MDQQLPTPQSTKIKSEALSGPPKKESPWKLSAEDVQRVCLTLLAQGVPITLENVSKKLNLSSSEEEPILDLYVQRFLNQEEERHVRMEREKGLDPEVLELFFQIKDLWAKAEKKQLEILSKRQEENENSLGETIRKLTLMENKLGDYLAKVKKLKEENDELQENQLQLKSQLENRQQKISSCEDRILSLELELKHAHDHLEDLQKNFRKKDLHNEELEKKCLFYEHKVGQLNDEIEQAQKKAQKGESFLQARDAQIAELRNAFSEASEKSVRLSNELIDKNMEIYRLKNMT